VKKSFKLLIILFCCASLISALLTVVLPGSIIKLYTGYIEKGLEVEVKFLSSPFRNLLFSKEWSTDGLKVSGDSGCILETGLLTLRPSLKFLLSGKRDFSLKAANLKFHKDIPILNSLCDLLSIEPFRKVAFDVIEADLMLEGNRLNISALKAEGGYIKISGSGMVDRDQGSIDFDLKFLLSEEVTSRINQRIRKELLREESAGWMSMSVEAVGDYKQPYLKVKSDLLHLNIRGIEIK